MGVDILLDWPLNPNSIIVEVGGYTGEWLTALRAHLGFMPIVLAYEPVQAFADYLNRKFSNNPSVQVFQYGLSEKTERVSFGVEGDRSGAYHEAAAVEEVQLYDVAEALANLDIALINLNCEGGEYSILPRLIESGLIKNCAAVQVQFHRNIPDYEAKRDEIRAALSLTHDEKFCTAPFIWEAWTRR